MSEAETRVAFVIRGVVQQAIEDAGATALQLAGAPSPASELIERWCRVKLGREPALAVATANKTELLLADNVVPADLYPLGDLYASELAAFVAAPLDSGLHELAAAAGGIDRLDGALHKLLDERRPADAAFADLPHIRDAVLTRLQKTRFRRVHLGIVPKLGARTIGIDLHI